MRYLPLLLVALALLGLAWLSRRSRLVSQTLLYGFLGLLALTMLLPFFWMFVLSTHLTADIYTNPPPFWFGSNLAANYRAMNEAVNVGRSFFNSLLVATAHTSLVLLFCSMGGYAFSVYDFPGKRTLFAIVLATMMIPGIAGIIPWFFLITKLGWINNFLALIIPGAANAFGIFWMRQYCQNNVPVSLMEAAKIDGCPEWRIFFRVVAPILLPAYSALGIMQFVNVWNDFMVPMLVLRDANMRTLPIMLSYMRGDPTRGTNLGAMMLASTLTVLPLLIAFLSASKYFMSGLTAGAIKE
ncbi:MAG: carbohydrate ABC transporter permease [Clostridiales bacterium]|nr:carbohydrate ABC transporter permease [Clostridiales bacterium]